MNQVPTGVNISTAFRPNSFDARTDCVLISEDDVHFFIHSQTVLALSDNAFNSYLRSFKIPNARMNLPVIVKTSEPSAVLNIILHALYDLSCSQFSHSLTDVSLAVDKLQTYGIQPAQLIAPTKPFFQLLLSHASQTPLDVYTLAASHALEDLAVATSAHLLSLKLWEITDEISAKIGGSYLKRLFDLHSSRVDALKRLLAQLPTGHPPVSFCVVGEPEIHKQWRLALADLTWELRPGKSSFTSRLSTLSTAPS
jgi:hypothetical protein